MSRCVCTHIRALHVDGKCQAKVNPCGCTTFETEAQAQHPALLISREDYQGRYGKRYKP